MPPKRKAKTLQVPIEEDASINIPQKKRDYKQSRKSKYSSAQAYTNDTVSGYKKQKLDKNSSKIIKTEQSEADELIEADLDEEIDADADLDDYADDKSDCKYKLTHNITVFVTLPSGDEEVIPDFQISFTDKSMGGADELIQNNENMQKAREDMDNEPRIVDINNIEWEFKLQKLVNHIKKQGYPIENTFVSYYSSDFNVQINCGADPISQAITICPSDIEENPYTKELSMHLVFTRGYKEDIEQVEKLMHNENLTPDLIALQRNKERSIGFIIEKVTQWRKLYNGFYDENHELKRMSLEQAATEVGVSKKSLDDYLSQIRQGRTNGFDFNKNKHQKVGKLRTFNKDIKKQLDLLKK